MSRARDRHPLGKLTAAHLDIPFPPELRLKLNSIAAIDGKQPTTWARDLLEQAIEGRWIFIQRRVGLNGDAGQSEEHRKGKPE